MPELSGYVICPALFCGSVCLLLGGALFVGSFVVGEKGADLAAEVDAIGRARAAVCTFGAALAAPPDCYEGEQECLYYKACSRRLAGEAEEQAEGVGGPRGGRARALGSQCCAAYHTPLICNCPVTFGVALEGGGSLEARAAVVAQDRDASGNNTEWCSALLATPPYSRLNTTGPNGAPWACGYTDDYGLDHSCAPGVRPGREVPCVVDAGERVLVGSREFLTDSYQEKQESTDSTAGTYRAVGVVLLLLPCTPLFVLCVAQCYKGYQYREGVFGSLWRLVRGRPSQPFFAPEPTAVGRQ